MKHPIITYLFGAIALLALHFALFRFVLNWEFRPSLIGLYVYMVLISWLFEYLIHRQPDAKQFVITYMGFSGGKMMLSLFVLLLYVFFNREYMVPFAVSFLTVYFFFTSLEIIRLLRFLKK